jgi:GH35 family endo-1,4-beta-xylanase
MSSHFCGKIRHHRRTDSKRKVFLTIFFLVPLLALVLGIMPLAGTGAAAETVQSGTIADRFGIASSHLATFDAQTMDAEFQAMDEMQAGWVRCTMAWHDVEYRGSGLWNLEGCDMAVAKANQHGVKILGILCGCPAWANGGQEAFYPPTEEHLDDWQNYVRTMATRYKGKVAAWEIWNEENIQYWQPKPDPVYYTRLLGLASAEIRAADPAAIIVMGGDSTR